MATRTVRLAAWCLAAFVAGCQAPTEGTAMQDTSQQVMSGKVWQLVEAVPAAGQAAWQPSQPITLEIMADDGRVAGMGGCNRYFGGVKLDDASMTFEPLAGTRMACPPPAMEEEDKYLKALQQAKSYAIDGDVLTVTLADGGTLKFRPKTA